MSIHFRRSAMGAAILSLSAAAAVPALAQSSAANAAPAPAQRLGEVTVTGNPLGATELATPTTQLQGEDLTLRLQPTLGETLDGTPGVASTYFGPNASRPSIRGLDGDRIRILNNGGASLDASALSYDHAVPAEPLTVDRIEVLRGASALQYGGSAVGGVVNVIDNRIPRTPIQGVQGKADLGFATGNRERGGAAMVEGGNGRFALHVDAFDRKTDDVRVPTSLDCENPSSLGFARRICNSASHSKGGAVGGTAFFDHGYLGASASTYRSDYGTVAEDEVTIGMRSDRYAIEGEIRDLSGPFRSLKAQLSHTDYSHTEYEGGAAGTTFSNRGNEFRLEARQQKWGALDGVIGLQVEGNRFSAVGDEAFAPYSRTRSTALFAYEEYGMPWGKLNFGARTEQVKVQSFGNPDVARFTPAERSFNPHSAAVGALWKAAPGWQLTGNLAYTERAPKDYELFANGPHVATAAWETGDAELKKERSTGLDVGAAWKDGPHRAAVNVFYSRFQNYIGLSRTGNSFSADGEANPVDAGGGVTASGEEIYPEYMYRGVRARFTGVEASSRLRLVGKGGLARDDATAWGGSTLDLDLRGDLVRATDLSNGQPLARIAPARLGATLLWGQGAWGARLGFDARASQDRVAPGDRTTAGYTLWNAAVTYRMRPAGASSEWLWYARLDNITDRLAYSATSILTTTAYPKAPLPGRSLKVGVQVLF